MRSVHKCRVLPVTRQQLSKGLGQLVTEQLKPGSMIDVELDNETHPEHLMPTTLRPCRRPTSWTFEGGMPSWLMEFD